MQGGHVLLQRDAPFLILCPALCSKAPDAYRRAVVALQSSNADAQMDTSAGVREVVARVHRSKATQSIRLRARAGPGCSIRMGHPAVDRVACVTTQAQVVQQLVLETASLMCSKSVPVLLPTGSDLVPSVTRARLQQNVPFGANARPN